MFQMKVKKHLDLANRLRVISKGNFRPFMNIAGRETIKDITGNIKRQIEPTGARLKENAPTTKIIKQRLLGHTFSLIWNRILISPSTYIIKSTKNRARIMIKPVRHNIAKWVEAKGYHFFAFSNWVKISILKEFRLFIMRGLR